MVGLAIKHDILTSIKGIVMEKEQKQNISYFRWDGDPCRIIEDENGNVTADIYCGGRGHLPISETDILFNGVNISEEEYKELVLEEIALNKNKN